MKTLALIPFKTFSLAALICVGMGASANALPPTGRHRAGVVESIDYQAQRLTFRADGEEKSRGWTWNKRTRFVRDVRFVDPAALRKGARAEVIQHSPFFGEPFVTKVVILAAKPADKSR